MRHHLPHVLALVLAVGAGFSLRPVPTTAEPTPSLAAVPMPTAIGRRRFSHWLLVPTARKYVDIDNDGNFDQGDRFVARGKVLNVDTLGEQADSGGDFSWVEDFTQDGGAIQLALTHGRAQVPESQLTVVVRVDGGAFTIQGGTEIQANNGQGNPPVRPVIGGVGKYRTYRGYAAMEFAQNQEDVRLALTNRD